MELQPTSSAARRRSEGAGSVVGSLALARDAPPGGAAAMCRGRDDDPVLTCERPPGNPGRPSVGRVSGAVAALELLAGAAGAGVVTADPGVLVLGRLLGELDAAALGRAGELQLGRA